MPNTKTTYEWVAEEVDDFGDVIDPHFEDTRAGAERVIPREGCAIAIALVRNTHCGIDGDLLDRGYAYLNSKGDLPARFDNGEKVPKRFF